MRNIGIVVSLAALLWAGPAQAQGKKSPGKAAGTGIHSPKTGDAVAAAKKLGESRSPRAVETLLDALAMGLRPQVAAAAIEALGQQGKGKAFDTISYYLHHRSPKVRASAVKAMGALADKRAAAKILAALRDGHKSVRAAASDVVARKKLKRGTEALLALLKKGDEASAAALASMAKPDLARAVAELIGTAPDQLVARCLGAMLMRPDFKPEDARVEVVKSLGKIPGNDALEQLTSYVASIPEKPPRASRKEAEAIVEARMGGG